MTPSSNESTRSTNLSTPEQALADLRRAVEREVGRAKIARTRRSGDADAFMEVANTADKIASIALAARQKSMESAGHAARGEFEGQLDRVRTPKE